MPVARVRVLEEFKKNPVFCTTPVYGSYTETGVRVRFAAVAEEGVVTGNPLKESVGPVVVVTLLRLFTERLMMAAAVEPRLATA
jgi:hypothetical protein